jgi:hypothetical protein
MKLPLPLRRIALRRWSWIGFKVVGFLYGLALLLFTPQQITETLPNAIHNVAGALMVGAVISIVGLVMVSQTGRVAVWGLTVELVGIGLVAGAVLGYFITQLYLVFTLPNGTDRVALCVLLVWVIAALVARFSIVYPRRAKEGHDPRKDV